MLIDTSEEGLIRLENVYNPIIFVCEKKTYSICERDGDIEILELYQLKPRNNNG